MPDVTGERALAASENFLEPEGSNHLQFTPPFSLHLDNEDAEGVPHLNLDSPAPTPSFQPAEGPRVSPSIAPSDGHSKQSIDHLPEHVERWAQMQRRMHIVGAQCTFILQGQPQSPITKNFTILTFLLTQGSGKDKVFKLLQNLAALIGSLEANEEKRVKWLSTEERFSRARKVLRSFKVLSEISKIFSNSEPDARLRWLMYFGNMCSIQYFILDHLIGLIELGFARVGKAAYEQAKWWKNVFSVLRLLTAFTVDTIYYHTGRQKRDGLRKMLQSMLHPLTPAASASFSRANSSAGQQHPVTPLAPSDAHSSERLVQAALTELKAIAMHRAHLRRNFVANSINLALLLSSLNFPLFRRMSPSMIALCGITTAILGIYKVLRRISDNQLTLQFA